MPGKDQAKALPGILGKHGNGTAAQITVCDRSGKYENSQ